MEFPRVFQINIFRSIPNASLYRMRRILPIGLISYDNKDGVYVIEKSIDFWYDARAFLDLIERARAGKEPENLLEQAAVSDALRRLGLEPERMGVAGCGLHQPVAPNLTGEDRAKNRRVELFVMAPEVPVVGWTESTPTLY